MNYLSSQPAECVSFAHVGTTVYAWHNGVWMKGTVGGNTSSGFMFYSPAMFGCFMYTISDTTTVVRATREIERELRSIARTPCPESPLRSSD